MKDPDTKGLYLRGSIYWLNLQVKGVRQFVSLETSDFAEAKTRAAEIRVHPSLTPANLFNAEIEAFIAYKRRKHEFTAASAHGRRFILKAFARFVGKVSPAHVTPADTQNFYDHHLTTHTATTANTYANILRSFFNWCVAPARLIRHNPCAGLDMAKDDTKGRMRDFCSETQRDLLIKTCTRDDLKFVLYCGFHAGLRKNEIIEARPFWFDLDNGLLHLRKTSTMQFKDREERTIPLTGKFHAFLKSYGLREPFMLRPEVKHGANRYRYDFTRPLHEHCDAHGLGWVTPHTMRHTFASLLASAGRSLYKISIWLGDDPRVVDRRYARLKPNDPEIDPSYHTGHSPAVKRSTQRSKTRRS